MKKGKKIVIGVAAVAVVAGGIYAASGAGRGGSQIPQVAVTKAETGDVGEIVDATGTVVSDEQKTFYSPVNAQIKSVSFAEGDTVSKGTKLIEFEVKDLERDNQKADSMITKIPSINPMRPGRSRTAQKQRFPVWNSR